MAAKGGKQYTDTNLLNLVFPPFLSPVSPVNKQSLISQNIQHCMPQMNQKHTHAHAHTHTHIIYNNNNNNNNNLRPFVTIRVSRYQKKHSPTHTSP